MFVCRYEARNQLLLNLGKPEVQDYIYDRVSSVIEESGIDYIKWDMNRPFQGMRIRMIHEDAFIHPILLLRIRCYYA